MGALPRLVVLGLVTAMSCGGAVPLHGEPAASQPAATRAAAASPEESAHFGQITLVLQPSGPLVMGQPMKVRVKVTNGGAQPVWHLDSQFHGAWLTVTRADKPVKRTFRGAVCMNAYGRVAFENGLPEDVRFGKGGEIAVDLDVAEYFEVTPGEIEIQAHWKFNYKNEQGLNEVRELKTPPLRVQVGAKDK